jgi:hypothetical protein
MKNELNDMIIQGQEPIFLGVLKTKHLITTWYIISFKLNYMGHSPIRKNKYTAESKKPTFFFFFFLLNFIPNLLSAVANKNPKKNTVSIGEKKKKKRQKKRGVHLRPFPGVDIAKSGQEKQSPPANPDSPFSNCHAFPIPVALPLPAPPAPPSPTPGKAQIPLPSPKPISSNPGPIPRPNPPSAKKPGP